MGSTKCVIPGVHLKVFGRAIQSLSKIGDELYFDPLEEGLSLRTVNSSRSAYACFQFAPSFFITYLTSRGTDKDDASTEEGIRCKLTMKSVMSVFRSLSSIDKTVEKCKITFNVQEDKLVFQMYCRHGIVKTHNLSFMECETLQAIFSRDLCPNKLTAEPRLLCDAVINFQANQEEVTLLLRPDFVALKNYVEDEPNPSKVIHTELTLSPDEFDHFQVGVDTDVTFCLKEFRAILAFADLTALPINLHIESPGRPVTFAITSDLTFEANFVLATLADPEDAPAKSQSPTSTTNRNHHSGKSRQDTTRKTSKHQHSHQSSHTHNRTSRNEVRGDGDNEDYEAEINDTTVVTQPHSINNRKPESNQRVIAANETPNTESNDRHFESAFVNGKRNVRDDDRLNKHPVQNNALGKLSAYDNRNSSSSCGLGKTDKGFYLSASEESQSQQEIERGRECDRTNVSGIPDDVDDEMSQIIPIRNENTTGMFSEKTCSNPINGMDVEDDDGGDDNDDDDDDDDEHICGTPPSKKFRSLFFSTQSSTQSTVPSQTKAAILCPDSDSD